MKTLKYLLAASISVGIMGACTNKSNRLCDCVEAGQAVNKLSASFFERPATQEGKDSLDVAIAERDKICNEFDLESDMELQKLAEGCPSLKIETEEK